MEARQTLLRPMIRVALVAAIMGFASTSAITCDLSSDAHKSASAAHPIRVAGEGKSQENRDKSDRCKKNSKSRNGNGSQKGCSDGGERLPQDNRRSPLDDAPPLAPLVA